MKRLVTICALAAAAALLGGCGGGTNSGAVPTTTQANLSSDKLQVAVGTAFNAADGTTGLNVVATFRQPDGLTAVLADTPSITGPAGFTVPAGFPGAYGSNTDIGTATISSSPQVPLNQTPSNTTLGTFTGIFSYGLAPLNSDTSVNAFYPGNPNSSSSGAGGFTSSNYGGGPWWALPFGAAAANQSIFLEGPPAVPFFNDGTFPGSFAGYSPGFTAFEITPVAGTYTVNAKVSPSNALAKTFTASANLTSVAPLAAPALSAVTENGGGLTGTVTAGAGVAETLVFITDTTAGLFYTVEVTGTGAKTWTLPAMLGPCTGSGCESNASTQKPSIVTGDTYTVQAVSFNYGALEAGPPSNTSQLPTIVGSNGQADLAIGTAVSGPY